MNTSQACIPAERKFLLNMTVPCHSSEKRRNRIKTLIKNISAAFLLAAILLSAVIFSYAAGITGEETVDGMVESNPEDESAYTYSSAADAAKYVCAMNKFENITVIRSTSPSLYSEAVSLRDISEASEWTASDGTLSVTSADALARYPWKPLFDTNCISAYINSGESGEWHYIERIFSEDEEDINGISDTVGTEAVKGINLEECREISFAVNLPETTGISYLLRLQVDVSGTTVFDESFEIESGGWNTVFADISGVSITEQNLISPYISSIRIGVCPVPSDEEQTSTNPFTFYIDGFAFSSGSAVRKYRYMTDEFIVYGGTLDYDNWADVYRFNVTTSADSPFIETKSLVPQSLAYANAVRINFMDYTNCSSVTLYYRTSSENEYTEAESYTVAVKDSQLAGSNIISCCFSLPSSDISDFRISFKGCTSDGEITLLSVCAVSSTGSDSEKYGTIDSCKISQNTGEVNIKGTVSSSVSEKYQTSKINIYALEPWQTSDSATLSELQPAAQTKMSSEFSVKFQTGNYELKKYTAAVRTGTGFIILDSDKWITNLKGSSSSASASASNTYKKGIISEVTEAQSIGSQATYVTADISKLYSLSYTSCSYNYNGKTFYFDETEIDSLDKRIAEYKFSSINVYLRIIASMPADAEVASRILFDDAVKAGKINGGRYYAININEETGAEMLAALCKMIAERYKGDSYGSIAGIIVGDEINLAYEKYYAGEKTLSDFSSICADTIRIVYNSVISVNPELNVYISFGNDFYNSRGADSSIHFDVRELITAIADKISYGGNIDWLPAVTISKTNSASGKYSDMSSQKSYETQTLYSSELDVLCSFFKQKKLLYGDLPRNIMVLSESNGQVTSGGENDMKKAAEYIYDFYNVANSKCSLVNVFIVSPDFSVYEHEEMLRRLDTSQSLSATEKYARYFDSSKSSWEEIFGTEFIKSLKLNRNISETNIASTVSGIRGTAYLWDIISDKSTDGWSAAEGCGTLEASDLLDRKNIMVAKLLAADSPLTWRGILNVFEYTRDFSPFDYVSMEIQLANMPENIDNAEIMLMLSSGSDCLIAKSSVSTGSWNKLVFSLANFPQRNAVDGIKIFVRGTDGKTDIGTPTLLVSEIKGLSSEHDSKYLTAFISQERYNNLYSEVSADYEKLVPVLITVIIAAVVFEILYVKHRLKKQDSKQNKIPFYKRQI